MDEILKAWAEDAQIIIADRGPGVVVIRDSGAALVVDADGRADYVDHEKACLALDAGAGYSKVAHWCFLWGHIPHAEAAALGLVGPAL